MTKTETCPCNNVFHDHCFSVFIKPDDPQQHTGIRVCFQCYERMAQKKIITITIDEDSDIVRGVTCSASIVFETQRTSLPSTLARFESMIKCCVHQTSCPSMGACIASDGYAYTKEEFYEFYGSECEAMWSFAQRRTLVIQLVTQTGVLTEEDYELMKPQTEATPLDLPIHVLHELPEMKQYISPLFWPHEPVRPRALASQLDWVQVRSNVTIIDAMEAVQCKGMPAYLEPSRSITFAYRFNSTTDDNSFLLSGCNWLPYVSCTRELVHEEPAEEAIDARSRELQAIHGAYVPAAMPAPRHNFPHHVIARTQPMYYGIEPQATFRAMISNFPWSMRDVVHSPRVPAWIRGSYVHQMFAQPQTR